MNMFFRVTSSISLILFTIVGIRHAEHSRSLVISNGGIIKLIVGLAMPMELPVSLTWVQNFQFQYSMIDNAAQLTHLNLLRKSRSFSITRSLAYKIIGHTLDRFGVNGTACVLRTICEVSKLTSTKGSLLGSMLTTIFTPHEKTQSVYTVASTKYFKDDCNRYRSNCMEKLSTLYSPFVKKAEE